ncbi:pollen-specific leucine-rich repeat extensin-like protein 4 [Iris pallida]|uniref:Pollen-specific leucine-rich repeat extensin-like protein 4 n=1 Tax=Iris pallida TaxID=29817 RepID=A0AAX6I817_IRIPA|nr:pollen-specific leucine-rich repeat extensin-like protein 4 [Iris pallida]
MTALELACGARDGRWHEHGAVLGTAATGRTTVGGGGWKMRIQTEGRSPEQIGVGGVSSPTALEVDSVDVRRRRSGAGGAELCAGREGRGSRHRRPAGLGVARLDVSRTVAHRCRRRDRYGSGHGSVEGVLFSLRWGVTTGVVAWRVRWVEHDIGFDVYVMEDGIRKMDTDTRVRTRHIVLVLGVCVDGDGAGLASGSPRRG